MDNKLRAKIIFEISQIDKLLENGKPLFDLCRLKTPDFIEMSAAAMLLHSFYNGFEKILGLAFKRPGGKQPGGNGWHMELLDKASEADDRGKSVLSCAIKEKAEEYLKFRHFVRLSYGFQLEWERRKTSCLKQALFGSPPGSSFSILPKRGRRAYGNSSGTIDAANR